MNNLLFLTNELQSTQIRNEMKLPLHFIGYAFCFGKMYKYNDTSFVIPLGVNKGWGNQVIYGGLYLLDDYSHYIRVIDAYHSCSKSMLGINHAYDLMHRREENVTLITFDSIEDFTRLKFEEKATVQANAYFGNLSHHKIKHRIHNKMNNYRIQSGVVKSFTETEVAI